MDIQNVLNCSLHELISSQPFYADFLSSFDIQTEKEHRSFSELMDEMPTQFWNNNAISRHEMIGMFIDFAKGLETAALDQKVETVEVIPGLDKTGNKERCNLILKPGEITCIVGPTGSGKSRLLADIEWLANKDTPTQRRVLINNKQANDDLINNFGGKLIAQITQNMNFVLDMDVHSFLMLHAESRLTENALAKTDEVIEMANELSGEPFSPKTPVTFLSGGQSRALMIADVACIGQAPIVLIDEIENAGVDKKKALDLLVSKEKIVLMATHDPLLILLSDKRVVIKNGGMDKILQTNDYEKELYSQLEEIDNTMQMARNFFRKGNFLSKNEELSIT